MQAVDFDAIVKNAQFFKRVLKTSKLCAVLKNDAYGHGLVRTASALCGIADFFAVGNVFEALQIEPFSQNTLILLPAFGADAEVAVNHGFVLTVDSFDTLDSLLRCIPKNKKARVHLKIQTGMNRLGFNLEDLPHLVVKLDFSKMAVEGVFSHFFGETEAQCDEQLKIFEQAVSFLREHLSNGFLSHIANTSAVLLNSKYRLDMARVGLGLYGYGAPNLKRAKTVTARVIATRSVHKGEIVGYGGAHTFQTDTNVAVLNVGYANGFPRALKNAVAKRGNDLFPIVGNVCMAMCMADVKCAQVEVGEEVVLLGEGVNNANSQVIVYELLCNLR